MCGAIDASRIKIPWLLLNRDKLLLQYETVKTQQVNEHKNSWMRDKKSKYVAS